MPKKSNIEKLEFESFKKLKSYIIAIADKKVKEYYRKRQQNFRSVGIENIGDIEPEKNENREDLVTLVKMCYRKLPKRDQEVLFYSFNGYSSDEVAEELRVTAGTARARKRRALMKLKKLMEQKRK